MCGIAGFLGDFQPGLLKHFTDCLANRGPDGFGTWGDKAAGVGLAHRRLSIIDLSTAASQPMEGVEGRYQVVFNGEIYNFKSLRQKLQRKKYVFNPNSDTAVLAPLYDQHGPKMVEQLEGMFAIALWDRQERELWLARDHAGIKPLYYAETEAGLVFASELKALVGIPGVDLTPDPAALADYLTLLWSPGERTPVKGIKKLQPGHWLKARRSGKGNSHKNGRGLELEITRWWHPPLPALRGSTPVYDDSLRPEDLLALLDKVVAEQCTSDVPVGAFLSGGVDSSALVASMVANYKVGKGPLPARTYCIGFGGKGMGEEGFSDDLSHAKQVAKHLQVPLTPMMIEPGEMLSRLPGLARMLDEPTADPAPLFVQDICAQARADGITVLLSGTGGDDVMTGYRRHQTARLREKLGILRGPIGAGLGLAAGFIFPDGAAQRRAEKLAPLLRGSDEDFLLSAFKTNSQPWAWQLLREDWRDELEGGWRNALTEAREECAGQSLVNRLLYMEQFGFLPDHNLNYGDKASMASGVEVRVPLIDRRLMNFMAKVSPEKKLSGTRLKAFFKDAVSPRLPMDVISRSKAGFGAPIRLWLTGPGQELMEDTLFSNAAGAWFDEGAVGDLWRKTRRGEVDGAYACLAVAMVVWWRQGLSPE